VFLRQVAASFHAQYTYVSRPFTTPASWAANDGGENRDNFVAHSDTAAAKKKLRKEVVTALAALSASEVTEQSAAVATRFVSVVSEMPPKSLVSIFLPIDGGKQPEVDTWPIVARLLEDGHRVAVPLVTGPRPTDMLMARVPSYEALRALPLDKWRIPSPPRSWLEGSAKNGDLASSGRAESNRDLSEFALVVLPCVAVSSDGRRLGHGRGYYDAFLSKVLEARKVKGLPPPLTVGLALEPQLRADVPMDAWDKRLDIIVAPSGVWFTAPRGNTTP
jgi:5-formyltetrahydrofolate cyclo-ligase